MNGRMWVLCRKFYKMKTGDIGDRPMLAVQDEKPEFAQADLHALDGAAREAQHPTFNAILR